MGLLVAVDVYRGGVALQHYDFSSDSLRLVRMGKLPSAQVRLEDPAASRVHAIIELSPTQAMLVDMGADAGTLVNGKRVSKIRLAHGDQITVGATVLVVGLGVTGRDDAAPPLVAPPPPAAPAATAPASDGSPAAAAGPAAAFLSPTPTPAAAPATSPATPRPGGTVSASGGAARSLASSSAIGQRILAKLAALPLEAVAEADRYCDWLLFRQQQAGSGPAGTPAGQASRGTGASVLAQAAAARAALRASSPGPVTVGAVTGPMRLPPPMSPPSAPYVPPGVPFDSSAPTAVPPRDTQTYVKQMRHERRMQQLAVAGVLLVVVLVLLVIVLRPSHSPFDVPAGAAAPTGENAGAAAVAPASSAAAATSPNDTATAPPAPAEAVADDKSIVYRLPKDQSLHDAAAELWPNVDNAALLMSVNPAITSAASQIARGTLIRIPRTTTYQVKPGDTLASIAAKTLGRGDAYGAIQEANKQTLPDADSLEVGATLTIPLIDSELEKRVMRQTRPAEGAAPPSASAPAAPAAPRAPVPPPATAAPPSAAPAPIPAPVGAPDAAGPDGKLPKPQ